MGKPFSNPTGNYNNFIEIYLDNLNEDLKTELNEYRIEDNLFPSNTLFNYPSLIKLNQKLLFILFIDNEANLHTLEIELNSSTWNSHFNNISELILQNPNFIIHNIKNSNFYTCIHNDSTIDNTYMIDKNLILQLINLHQKS
ncbi:hypothetical protein C1646_767944 [Rhizophagus diaphanus]|nr:hypothetical protein C1646_767944 [Rhizophagus diaphanus] [Rhizophagus sp. MUCL 43196]